LTIFASSSASDRLLIRFTLLSRGRMQNAVKGIISLANDDSRKERKLQIKGELEVLRNQQSDKKFNRGKVIEQLGALQGGIQKQVRHSSVSVPHT
jgi:hypothetical protein